MKNQVEFVTNLAIRYPEMLSFQHFFVEESVVEFAFEQAMDNLPGEEDEELCHADILCPTSSKLPAKKMTIAFESTDMFFALTEMPDGENVVLRYNCEEWSCLGGIRPGLATVVKQEHDKEIGPEKCHIFLYFLSYIIALINEPRILARKSGASRQQRRALHRGMGFAIDAWTRVGWDLSKSTVAKVSNDPSFHKIPLHWRRGHFRHAESHYVGAMQRPDAFREEDRDLWWQWIKGQWVGHPAFGIKKSIHAPKMSGDALARRRAA